MRPLSRRERGKETIDEDGGKVQQEIKENDGRTLSIALQESKGRTGQITGVGQRDVK